MFFLARRSQTHRPSSMRNKYFFSVGLISVFGLIGGSGLLIYGIFQGNRFYWISGAAILGISIILGLIFIVILYYVYNSTQRHETNDHPRKYSQSIHTLSHPIHDQRRTHQLQNPSHSRIPLGHYPDLHQLQSTTLNQSNSSAMNQNLFKGSQWIR